MDHWGFDGWSFIGSVSHLKSYVNYCLYLDTLEYSEKFITSIRLMITPRVEGEPDATGAALPSGVRFDTSIVGLLPAEQIHQGCLRVFL